MGSSISSSSSSSGSGFYSASYSNSYSVSQSRTRATASYTQTQLAVIPIIWSTAVTIICLLSSMISMLIGNAILRHAQLPNLSNQNIAKAASLGALVACPGTLILGLGVYICMYNALKYDFHLHIIFPILFRGLIPGSLTHSICASVGTSILLAAERNGHSISTGNIQAIDILHAVEAALVGTATIAATYVVIYFLFNFGCFSPVEVLRDLFYEPWKFKVIKLSNLPSRNTLTVAPNARSADPDIIPNPPPPYRATQDVPAPDYSAEEENRVRIC